MNVKLSDDVLNFLGENVKSNIRQLEGVIKKLGAYSFVNGSTITVDIAKKRAFRRDFRYRSAGARGRANHRKYLKTI